VCSMLASAGLDHAAFWLLRKTFKSYRTPDDTQTTAYQRFNYNYGVSLLEAGLIRNPIVREEDNSNLQEWRTYADQNAFEFLARSYRQGNLLAGGGQLASLLAYRGQVGDAIALAADVTDKAEAAAKSDGAGRPQAWLDLCDIAIASVVVYDIVQYFTAPAEQLRLLAARAAALGDEPRRAMLCAHLGRLLTYTGHFDEADASLLEAEVIARRLDLSKHLVATRAARGLWLADSGTSPEDAVQTLMAVADELRAIDDEALVTHYDLGDPTRTPTVLKGRQPMLCRVLLDLTRAAMMTGRSDVVESSLDQLSELTDHFQGYIPQYCFAYAEYLARATPPDVDKAHALIREGRDVGQQTGNPSVDQYADYLDQKIDEIARR
jgi:hypothetical protein